MPLSRNARSLWIGLIPLWCIAANAARSQDTKLRQRAWRRLLEMEGLNVTLLPDGLHATSLDAKDKGSALAMCAVVKDQAKELDEWILHHQKLGFQTFYIMDDNSFPPLLEPLQKAIASGLVDYHHVAIPGDNSRQRLTYDKCLSYGRHHQWMAFFDVDEFLVIKDTAHAHNLPAFLEAYTEYAGLAVNWRMFGSSGHLRPLGPSDKVAQSYTKCTESSYIVNAHVKSIVQPRLTERADNPHSFTYADGYFAVAPDFTRVDGHLNVGIQHDKIVLYHFYTKSWTEWLEKMARGAGDGGRKDWKAFVDMEEVAVHDCEPLQE